MNKIWHPCIVNYYFRKKIVRFSLKVSIQIFPLAEQKGEDGFKQITALLDFVITICSFILFSQHKDFLIVLYL